MSAKRKKRTKKQNIRLLTLFSIGSIVIVVSFILFGSNNESPKAFGIHIPLPYSVCGIDVSRYQEKIDWQTVANTRSSGKEQFNISFAFIKATEGRTLNDPRFNYNWEQAKKNGILRGAYHYYKPNVNSKLQADNFIASVKLEKGDLPPVLDIEERSKHGDDNMRKGIKNWLTIIEKHYGIKPIIYCYIDFYERYLCTEEFEDYPFWIAHYYKNKLRIKEKWYFWQHSDNARVNGIRTKVDFNVFCGTLNQLKALCKQ